MRGLLSAIGSPHACLPPGACVHVAGTKGKGSTVSMLAEILRAAGYRTGTYTSPHLLALRERISTRPGGLAVGAPQWWSLVKELGPAIEAAQADAGGALTHFEVVTALALAHFVREGVQVLARERGSQQ